MLFRGPMGGGAASGKAGSLVASHNSGGQYLRARTTPTNPATSQQVGVRNALATISNAYTAILDDAQRAAWKVYGLNGSFFNRLGDSIQLSGIAAFIRNNGARVSAGDPRIDDAPTVFVDTVLSEPVPSATNPDTVSINFTNSVTNSDPWLTDTAGHLYIYCSRPIGLGITFYKGPYRLLGAVDGAAMAPTSPATFSYAALGFGPIAADQSLFFRFVAVSGDGRISPVIRSSAVVG